VNEGDIRTVFFAETPGVVAAFAFDRSAAVVAASGRLERDQNRVVVRGVEPSRRAAITVRPGDGGTLQIVLLSETDSLALYQGEWQGRERVFLTSAGLVLDRNSLRLAATDRKAFSVAMLPAPESISVGGRQLRPKADGVFKRFNAPAPGVFKARTTLENLQAAGPARDIPLGKIKQPVAAAPEDSDFKTAAVWRVKLPAQLDLNSDPLLRVSYVGDVARVTLNGKLVTDDFYNGNAWEIGLRRHAPEILKGDLRIAILPLRKDAPIYLAKEAKPDFGKTDSFVELRAVEIVPRYQVQLTAP
jgi:hypothetical protein